MNVTRTPALARPLGQALRLSARAGGLSVEARVFEPHETRNRPRSRTPRANRTPHQRAGSFFFRVMRLMPSST